MEINLIKEENLNNVIEFVMKGFSWSSYRSKKVKNFLLDANNKIINFYGFYLSNSNNQIIGAIFSPIQGKYYSEQVELYVVNLMAWYVLPQYRGMESLRLAKYAVEYLDSRNFIITNFTPNKVAKKVFINFGFKNMEIFTARLFFFEGYKYFLSFLFKKIFIKEISLPSGYFNFNENFKGGVLTYKINFNDNEIIFKSIRVMRKKKLFGLKISYPVLHITPLTNSEYIFKNIHFFSSYISYYFFVLFVEIDLEKKYLKHGTKKYEKFKSRYIFFTREKLIKFLPFFGSELSLN